MSFDSLTSEGENYLSRLQLPRFAQKMLLGAFGAWWLFMLTVERNKRSPGSLLGLGVMLFAILGMLLELVLRVVQLNRGTTNQLRQIQAVNALYTELKPEHALPLLSHFTLLPETALWYIRVIRHLKPELIVELGSGASTMLAALQLEHNGTGKVIAIDHDTKWGARTTADLKFSGHQDRAEVWMAPLKSQTIEGQPVSWYDTTVFDEIPSIDLLLVDGPPDSQDRLTRIPAIQYLKDKFHENTVIFADDTAQRPHWRGWLMDWAHSNGFVAEDISYGVQGGMLLFQPAGRLATEMGFRKT